jgi:hypothetical protein
MGSDECVVDMLLYLATVVPSKVLGPFTKLQPNLPSCNRMVESASAMVLAETSALEGGRNESPQHAPAQLLLAG